MDFGIGSDELKVENSALLISMLEDDPMRVQALFAEEPVEDVFDENTQSNRGYKGISYGIQEFIENFLSGEDGTGRKEPTRHILTALIRRMIVLMTK